MNVIDIIHKLPLMNHTKINDRIDAFFKDVSDLYLIRCLEEKGYTVIYKGASAGDVLHKDVGEECSVRLRDALKAIRIDTWRQCLDMLDSINFSKKELVRHRNIGAKSVQELDNLLQYHGFPPLKD